MAGIIPDEGKTLLTNLIFKGGDVNRGTNLELGLFTNSSVSTSTILGDLVEPTGGSYARIQLVDANWSLVAGYAVYAMQSFQPVGTAYAQPIYGYFIATKGTVPKLLGLELDVNGPYTMTTTGLYDVTPKVKI
jgi:hypothetical protein